MQFWFGRIYKDISSAEIIELHDSAIIYEVNKNKFIKTAYKDRAKMKRSYKDFQKIVDYEINLNKDLIEFTENEVNLLLTDMQIACDSNTSYKRLVKLIHMYRNNNANCTFYTENNSLNANI